MALHWNVSMIVAEHVFHFLCESATGGDSEDMWLTQLAIWHGAGKAARG
jgi:hypothetical protein